MIQEVDVLLCYLLVRHEDWIWIPESECKRLNSFLSLSATYINLLLNGSLQRFGPPVLECCSFTWNYPCGWCSITPEKKEKHTKFNYQYKDPPSSVYRGGRHNASQLVVWWWSYLGWNASIVGGDFLPVLIVMTSFFWRKSVNPDIVCDHSYRTMFWNCCQEISYHISEPYTSGD